MSASSPAAVDREVLRQAGFDPAASAGVFVGVSQFEDNRIHEVPFAVDDAVDLAHLFALELGLIAPNRLVLALAGKPKKAKSAARLKSLIRQGARRIGARQHDFYKQVSEQARAAGPQGLFLLSVASHGVSDQGGDFIVATDSFAERKLRTGVSLDELLDDVARGTVERRLLLIDTCRERLTAGKRGLGEEGADPGAAMAASFAQAMGKARGSVLLAGATQGGYSFDDFERRNGVFTGAILDGLSGKAPADERGWITPRTLASFVEGQVIEWVKVKRPDYAAKSFGILKHFDGPAETLPLAVDPERSRAAEIWRGRRIAALARLKDNPGGILKGADSDYVESQLPFKEPPPKVFLSYSWDSPAHSDRVRKLADRLIADGIDCVLDRYVHPPPPQGWATWMREEVASSAFVLVVCSDGYSEKAQGHSQGGGLGVRFESVLVLQELYDQRMWNQRFVPVLLGGAGAAQVWEPLRTYHRYQADSEDGYEDLYRRLTDQPALVRPPPGTRKVLPPRNAKAERLVLPWASASGEDKVGLWADFAVNGQTHRFRWVPPGEFWMGSRPGEAGRRENEGPRHQVSLTEGFWLGETPCPQALWQAVMGENPSRFRSPDRPVEQVSWDDCQRFLSELNQRVRGLEARLPTEAEWEYACRAGTETSTYAGELVIQGANNGPLLEAIAWYGGNSGEDFDLENGIDSSTWPEKQFDHKEAGTRKVKQKRPNNWGFYDMVGNVWEWCEDRWQDHYESAEVANPTGPAVGSGRVFRGGSWYSSARRVRAAMRFWLSPELRNDNLGFRLARGQVSAQ